MHTDAEVIMSAAGRHRDLETIAARIDKAAGDYPPRRTRIHWRVSINDFGVEALAAE